MVPVVMRLRLKAAAGLLVFAAAGAPRCGLSQAPADSSASGEQRGIIARIEAEQARHGVSAAELIEPLTDLALFYQEHGDVDLATAAAERANGIVRANFGLASLEQAPLLRLLSVTAEARGDVQATWELEGRLFELVQRHPGDLGTIPILYDLVVRRVRLEERYRGGEIPPQIALGCYYGGGPLMQRGNRTCSSGSKGVALKALERETDLYRLLAVRTILGSSLYASGQIDELEAEAVDNCRRYRGDLLAACPQEVQLIEQLAYHVGTSLPGVDALIRLADWQLVGRPWWRPLSGPLQRASGVAFSACAQCGEPLELYWRAYEQLQRQGVAQDVIDGVFAPRVPVLLPGAIERALTEPVGESDRYIDVAFGITREGRAVDVEVRAAGRDVSRAQRFKLVARIENARFRPIIRNGEMADVTPVLVRYEPPELRGGSEQGGLDSPPDSPPR